MSGPETFHEQLARAASLIVPVAEMRGVTSRDLGGLLHLAECEGLRPLEAAWSIRDLLLLNHRLDFWRWFEIVYVVDCAWELFCRLLKRPQWRWSWQVRATNLHSLRLFMEMIEMRRISRDWLSHFADSLRGSEYQLFIDYFKLGLVEGHDAEQ